MPKVPFQAQTVDLPYGDASGRVAGGGEGEGGGGEGGGEGGREGGDKGHEARERVTRGMRVDRRKGIKERNFLITMG